MPVITVVGVRIRGTLGEIAPLNKFLFWVSGLGFGFRVWGLPSKRATSGVKKGHL